MANSGEVPCVLGVLGGLAKGQTGRYKVAHSEGSCVFVGSVGKALVIGQASHAVGRILMCTVELCSDNLIRTNTPAAPENCC